MKIRFTIAIKLMIAFGILVCVLVLSTVTTYFTLNYNLKVNDSVINVYTPALKKLTQLQEYISDSKLYIKSWVYLDRESDTKAKQALILLHTTDFAKIKSDWQTWVDGWTETEKLSFYTTLSLIEDSLFLRHRELMSRLSSPSDYDDLNLLEQMKTEVSDTGAITLLTDRIIAQLQSQIQLHNIRVEKSAQQMRTSFDTFQLLIISLGMFLVLLSFVIASFTIRSLTRPVNMLKDILFSMSKGIMPKDKILIQGDEIGEMAQAMNDLAEGLRKTSQFAIEIGKGNFQSDFVPLSKSDDLGNALLSMRDDLQRAYNEQIDRRVQDDERNWYSTGIAKFSELIRVHSHTLDELAYKLISQLVQFVGANQAAFYLLNDTDANDPVLEMVAIYAYDRRRYSQRTVRVGESLVGSCFREKRTLYFTNIPDGYVYITSGLGKATPTKLILAPLIFNGQPYGIIEIASFYEFRPIKIELIEKVSEVCASVLSSLKTSLQTAKLFDDLKRKNEQLSQQEEELRQNLDEMMSTQNEYELKQEEILNQMDGMQELIPTIRLSAEGNIQFIDKRYLALFGKRIDEVYGKEISLLLPENERAGFQKKIQTLTETGKPINQITYITNKQRIVKVHHKFSLVKDADDNITHIVGYAINCDQ